MTKSKHALKSKLMLFLTALVMIISTVNYISPLTVYATGVDYDGDTANTASGLGGTIGASRNATAFYMYATDKYGHAVTPGVIVAKTGTTIATKLAKTPENGGLSEDKFNLLTKQSADLGAPLRLDRSASDYIIRDDAPVPIGWNNGWVGQGDEVREYLIAENTGYPTNNLEQYWFLQLMREYLDSKFPDRDDSPGGDGKTAWERVKDKTSSGDWYIVVQPVGMLHPDADRVQKYIATLDGWVQWAKPGYSGGHTYITAMHRCMFLEYTELGVTEPTGIAISPYDYDRLKTVGYGIHIIHMKNGQTTADEPEIPSPHDPPDESSGGTYTIVKSYRTKTGYDASGNPIYSNDGTFSKTDSVANIKIEDEFDGPGSYKLVQFRMSKDDSKTRIEADKWEAQVPPHTRGGILPPMVAPIDITLADRGYEGEKAVYLLLEKVDSGQTTCDEPKIPDPHDPPDESTGDFKIVKSYRIKKADGTYQHVDTKYKDNSCETITIENELKADGTGYNLVKWSTADIRNYNPSIDSTDWYNRPEIRSSIRNGITKTTITLTGREKVLYLLLEKVEGDTQVADADYILSESTVARKIALSKPDTTNPTWGFSISEKAFQWMSDKFECDTDHTYYNSKWSDWEQTGTRRTDNPVCDGIGHTDHSRCYGSEPVYGWVHKHSTATNKCDYTTSGVFDDQAVSFGSKNTVDNTSSKISYDGKVTVGTLPSNIITLQRNGFGGFGDSVIPIKGWDYHTIIYRGEDSLTLAGWKNTDLGATIDSWITSKFPSTTSGSRKPNGSYMSSFDVKLEPFSSDNVTRAHATNAKVSGEHTSDNCTESPVTGIYSTPITRTYSLDSSGNPDAVASITISPKVKVEVYKGEAQTGSNAIKAGGTSYTPFGATGNYSRGTEISVGSVTFKPYIQMNYDNNIDRDATVSKRSSEKKVYVLGEYERTLKLNDYAEVSWENPDTPNITLFSLQWSTHKSALDFSGNFESGKYNVLPGGATMNLIIDKKKNATQYVYVTTYQSVIEGSGKTQIQNTNGSLSTLFTFDEAKKAHDLYVESVKQNIEKMRVEQLVDQEVSIEDSACITPSNIGTKQLWDINDVVVVEPSAFLKNGVTASKDSKYFLSEDKPENTASEGDFDILSAEDESVVKYTFFANTLGEIRFTKNNSDVNKNSNERMGDSVDGNSIAIALNQRTHIVDNLKSALQRGKGNDKTGRSNTGNPNWYNEAFDGVTVYVFRTKIEVGFVNPVQRTHVLDPKLTKPQTGQKGMLDPKSYNISQYCTAPLPGDTIGIFKGNPIHATNIQSFIYSDKFFIPNMTVQDLH